MFQLLKTERFLPLFLTQALEAFNDNLFKNALVILITFKISLSIEMTQTLVAAAAGIFILPFFLFSATAGLIADKFDKAKITRMIKLFEILAMMFAAIGFLTHHLFLLFFTLFLMGIHSAFFGPIKYSILPQHLHPEELIAGNALVEASTFIAILLGTILGGILIPLTQGEFWASLLGLMIAVLGLICSFFIPAAPAQTNVKMSFNIFSETFSVMQYAYQKKNLFIAIIGISWFWLIGAFFLSQIPPFTKDTLNANAHVVTLFLALFSIGIATGSLLCGKLLRGSINKKYMPISLIMMSIFIIDLFFSTFQKQNLIPQELIDIHSFLQSIHHWRIIVDLFFMSIAGGFYIVPLYTYIQKASEESHRSRVIAANNILNALFMVLAAIAIIVFVQLSISIPMMFLIVGVINASMCFVIQKL